MEIGDILNCFMTTDHTIQIILCNKNLKMSSHGPLLQKLSQKLRKLLKNTKSYLQKLVVSNVTNTVRPHLDPIRIFLFRCQVGIERKISSTY